MKIDNRSEYVGARMTESERNFLVSEADERGLRLSEYIRRTLLVNMPPVDKNSA